MSHTFELLAPAGGPEQLRAALAAGADALYLGFGHHFNARRGAVSFDDETFAAACRQAHLAGARVYVTVNVVIKTDEMTRALALVRRAWLLGADAFIIQDWGLLDEVRRRWPQIEVHVSTQANVHDARGVAWCRERWGVERVTLSRELSLPEIGRISREGVELEGFAHGALCFCYSGICMMSSLGGGRSAHRGGWAQPCRLPYDVVDASGALVGPTGTRPLCPKDYCTVDRLDELAQAGLSSLKLEGRLKAPDYVHAVVRAYRSALDEREGAATELSPAQRERLLRRAFNRDFTSAYLDGASDNAMMSYERSNNRGELVGTVVATRDLGSSRVWRGGSNGGRERSRKVTRAEVDVLLDAPVGKGDLLEVRPVDDPSQFLTTNASRDAQVGEVLTCRTPRPMDPGCPVRVIRSQAALDAAVRVARSDIPRKRTVDVRVEARLGEPFVVELRCVDDERLVARAEGPVVEPARTRPLTREDLIEHVGRMGGSAVEPRSFEVVLDEGCGLSFAQVHSVRAEACRHLVDSILAPYAARELSQTPTPTRVANEALRRAAALAEAPVAAPEVCALVAGPAAARAARAAGATRLYANAGAPAPAGGAEDMQVVPVLDEVCREGDHARLDRWMMPGKAVAVGNVSELALAAAAGALPEVRGCIPVHNTSALVALEEAGACGLWLSPEVSLAEIAEVTRGARVPVGIAVRGRTRAMTSEHCVLQVAGRCIHNCAACSLRARDLRLRNDKGDLFPVRTDLQGRSRIYASRPLDATPEIPALMEAGVRRFLVDATLLTPEQAAEATREVVAQLARAEQGEEPLARLAGHTSGHLLQPIS